MRVLLIGDYPPPFGGIAIHVQQLHNVLRRAGTEAFVIDSGKEARPAPDVLPIRRVGSVLRRILKRGTRPTVVHLHTSGNNPKAWVLAGGVGGIARACGARRVITLHSGLLPAYLAGSASRRRAARLALASYEVIVAVSEALVQALVAAGVPARKLRCCPAFCASEVHPGLPPMGWAELRASRSPLVVMADHPSPVYGRRLMLQALAHLRVGHPGIGLALFGPGTEGDARENRGQETAPTGQGNSGQEIGGTVASQLWEEARAFGVDDLVDGFGPLEHAEALALIASADAFVRPTTADGDAISVREALALETPCVASDVSARPDGTYLFKTGDVGALANAVKTALRDGPGRAQTLDAGPFLLALYRELSAPPPRSGHATNRRAGPVEARPPGPRPGGVLQ